MGPIGVDQLSARGRRRKTAKLALSADGCAYEAAELAWAEILHRTLDRHGVVLDIVDVYGRVSLPTLEQCREGGAEYAVNCF